MCNLTKVRPLFTIMHRGSENAPLLDVFSAYYIDQSNRDFYAYERFSEALTFCPFDLRRLHARETRKCSEQQNDFHHLQKYMKRNANNKVHTNFT